MNRNFFYYVLGVNKNKRIGFLFLTCSRSWTQEPEAGIVTLLRLQLGPTLRLLAAPAPQHLF
jgi:hypothetical protein